MNTSMPVTLFSRSMERLAAVVVVAAEELYLFWDSGASADAPLSLFHGRGFRLKSHVSGRKAQTIKQSAQKDGAKFGGGGFDRSRENAFEKQ